MVAWTERGGGLEREFRFRDFVEAFSFMTRVALVAERMGHHPEWSNVYGTVRVRLSTHDAGGVVTERDRELARAIDELVVGSLP
jgi:4a-hydroxytetrahydrobiopterin dehydratase